MLPVNINLARKKQKNNKKTPKYKLLFFGHVQKVEKPTKYSSDCVSCSKCLHLQLFYYFYISYL